MIQEFTAQIVEANDASMVARIVPFGVKVPYRDTTVEFARGQIDYPESVPLTIDHDRGVLSRVGVMTRHFETDEGAFAEFQIADTQAGTELRSLMTLGAVTDVSVGVEVETNRLDHVAVVDRGRFGQAENPSKVLSVHHDKEAGMAEETTEDVVPYDDSDLRAEVVRLTDQVDVLENRVVDESPPGDIHDFVLATMRRDETKLREFALAVDTTTTAAGVVPDYLSGEIISIIDTARPFVTSFRNDPIGDAGMSVVYPLVTQKPTVAVQAVENTEVESTAFTIGTTSFDLATYSGANRSSIQLIERSQPSFVQALFGELAGAYAIATEAAAIATALTAITQVEILADASTDAAATIASLAAANTQIIDGVRRPATHVWCGSTRWEQFLSLVDTAGRPLVTWPGGGPTNAFGTASLSAMTGSLSGLTLVLVPNMPLATDMIMGWAGAAANLEQSPQQLRALQVDTLSWELGVYGLYQFATKYAAGFVEFTLA